MTAPVALGTALRSHRPERERGVRLRRCGRGVALALSALMTSPAGRGLSPAPLGGVQRGMGVSQEGRGSEAP